MDDLTKLAIKYGTDKWGKHHYTPIYDEMFSDRRSEVKKVLEIGVGDGAGLRMWRDYFPNAAIYGAEIDKNRLFEEDRIKVFECDQSNYEDLTKLIDIIGGDVDLVIDDGSHLLEDQVFSCKTLMQKLHYGATYIIEDVAKPEISDELFRFYPEVIKVSKRYDDRLIVMKIDE